MLKSGGSDPKELYEMACGLMEAGESLKQVAYAMGYDEESDMGKISDEKQEENEEAYEEGDTPFVDQPTEGYKTYGDRKEEEAESDEDSDSEDEEQKPIGRKAILISLRKKFG